MKILLAEDDRQSSEFICKGLIQNGNTVDCVFDGREALSACVYSDYDLVILDRMMPEMDGLAVLKGLRGAQNETPVIFLTAMGDVDDRVEGLLAGGDDYLVKPFHFSELLARITAISRRPKNSQEVTKLEVAGLVLDLMARLAVREGVTIELKSKEFSMLEVLMRNAGKIVTRTMLLEQVWDFNFDPKTTVVETHISRLRAKIDKPFKRQLVHTVRNIGYSIHGSR